MYVCREEQCEVPNQSHMQMTSPNFLPQLRRQCSCNAQGKIIYNKWQYCQYRCQNESHTIKLRLPTNGSLKMITAPVSQPWRAVFLIAIAAASLLSFGWLASWFFPSSHPFDIPSTGASSSFTKLTSGKVLQDASPIFGLQDPNAHTAKPGSATWMKAYHDDTLLVHMNIPGTHDAATWNYTQRTQDSLHFVSELANLSPSEPAAYQCQDKPMIAMLEAGIRAFDLRYAFDITRTRLVFWHGEALQSETATVEDVLYAFFDWLDRHPSEALFLSFQHEHGVNDEYTQLALHRILTSPAARRYISQTRGTLGTLGSARGKITLLRRFDLSSLPSSYEKSLPGLHFSPGDWTVNGDNIALEYNKTSRQTAYIQDYYHPQTPQHSPLQLDIRWKLNATEAHYKRAASGTPIFKNALFWSFASSTNLDNDPSYMPRDQALGDDAAAGVNAELVKVLKGMKGNRLGITMFDFFEQPDELLPLYLSLLTPKEARNYGIS